MLCGDLIPEAAARVMAGGADVDYSRPLTRGESGSCSVYTKGKDRKQILLVQYDARTDNTAARAFADISRELPQGNRGYRLPPSEGYGIVGDGGDGTNGRNAFAITSSGNAIINLSLTRDAEGRDPVPDARALINLLGPKLAADWPKPPSGIDPLNPTSPPPRPGK